MRLRAEYLNFSAQIFFLSACSFFIYIEHFPIHRFIFNLIFLFAVMLIGFLITKKKYTSLVFASSLTCLIMIASILKQNYIGAYLYFSDFILFLKNPFFFIEFISFPVFISILFLFLIYISLLYVKEKKSKFKISYFVLLIVLLALIPWHVNSVKNMAAWQLRSKSSALQIFIASIYSDNSLKLPKSAFNHVLCCNIIKKNDLQISPIVEKKQNIVMILLESTFNLNAIPSLELSDQWETFKQRPLRVYTTGGATWTSEYAILHGVDPTIYGPNFYRINILGPGVLPGRIAPALKQIGYNTYSVLPHDRKFANTDNFHRSLGIDNIHDCKNSHSCKPKSKADRDTLMFNHIYSLLQNESKPAFVFALTKYQHSPHRLSKNNPLIKCETLTSDACNVLQEYKNREIILQSNIQEFLKKINSLDRDTIVIFFGDHIAADINRYVDESKFLNHSKLNTIAFGYSTQTRQFIDLHTIIGNCDPHFKLHIDDLDILPLYFSGLRSEYINQKFLKLKTSCCQDCHPAA